MSMQDNVQIVKDAFAAMGLGGTQRLLALRTGTIEWIILDEDWPLAGTHRGHSGLEALLRNASETMEATFPAPLEFVTTGKHCHVYQATELSRREMGIDQVQRDFEDDS